MIESTGASYPTAAGQGNNTLNDRAHAAMDAGNMAEAGDLIGQILDDQVRAIRGTMVRR